MCKKELYTNDCNGEPVSIAWYPEYKVLEIEDTYINIITIADDQVEDLRNFLTEILENNSQQEPDHYKEMMDDVATGDRK